MIKYIDTHTHTNSSELKEEFNLVINTLNELNMCINIVGCNKDDCLLAINQAYQSTKTYCTIGIHPNEINDLDIDKTIQWIRQLCLDHKNKIIAIGECGLDYYHDNLNVELVNRQKQWFRKQIELAIELNLPIMMHIRNAHDDAIKIISEYKDASNFIVHCFSGNKDDVIRYVNLNCYISISGIITFKKNDELREAVKLVPHHLLLTETDAPYLAPVPKRGKINYPQYVLYTNEYLANLLNLPLEEMNKKLINNAYNCFAKLNK